MKKGIIIFCSLAVLFAACTKPEPEPTPEPVDYAPLYVGNHIGQINLSINSINNEPQTNMTFPINNIGIDIAMGSEINTVTATLTADTESRQTTGTTTAEKLDFDPVLLVIDKPDQNYSFNLELKMEGTKDNSDTLYVVGSFSGNGKAIFMGQELIYDEVSGELSGTLVKQQTR